ncbi:MAG: hypothetical protein R3F62_05570 [Planctomycetota bacterium]
MQFSPRAWGQRPPVRRSSSARVERLLGLDEVYARLKAVTRAGRRAQRGPWATLVRFLVSWHDAPLELDRRAVTRVAAREEALGLELPRVLREFYLLAESRFRWGGGYPFTDPVLYELEHLARLPEGGLALGSWGPWELCLEPDLSLGWAPRRSARLPLAQLDAEEEPDPVLDVDLAEFLSAVVLENVLRHTAEAQPDAEGLLGEAALHAHCRAVHPCETWIETARRGTQRLSDPAGVGHLLRLYELFELAGKVFLRDRAEESWGILYPPRGGRSECLVLGTLTPEARERRDWSHQERVFDWTHEVQAEHAARADLEREAEARALAQAPPDPRLLAAVEALEPRLPRYERILLRDLRRAHAAGTLSDGQRLRALRLLETHASSASSEERALAPVGGG